jgi:predicted transcriptional regulator
LFCEKLTEKFVDGKITSDDTIKGIFTDVEFTAILNQIMTKNTLDSLVNKGLVNYFEDENGEELFFLTEDGKNIAKQTLQVSGDTNNILNK